MKSGDKMIMSSEADVHQNASDDKINENNMIDKIIT
jgi:hypothetical protein